MEEHESDTYKDPSRSRADGNALRKNETLYGSGDGDEDYNDKNNNNNNNSNYANNNNNRIRLTTSSATGHENSCSLRRTRSLAVIREETFNDLQITGGAQTRRSQLIPRAKLLNRPFFQDRGQRDTDNGSGDTQTSQESEEFYANLRSLDAASKLIFPIPPWQNDKSDLDSLDSSYFKNSLHQTSLDSTCQSQQSSVATPPSGHTLTITPTATPPVEFCTQSEDTGNSCEDESLLADTTTSNSDSPDTESSTVSSKRDTADSLLEIKLLDEILQQDESFETVTLGDEQQALDNHTSSHRGDNASLPDDNTSVWKVAHRDTELHSVVSYDSIYLSSETSSADKAHSEGEPEQVDTEHNCVVISTPAIHADTNPVQTHEPPVTGTSLDTLYSQVNKTKPKIVSLERKKNSVSPSNLTTFANISNRGTLERLTLLTTSQQFQRAENLAGQPLASVGSAPYSSTLYVDSNPELLYCSLPDAKIGKSLRAFERIDAKLRLSCGNAAGDQVQLAKTCSTTAADEPNPIYDSISRFGRAHKRLRQRENCEIVVLNSISIEEQPREAPSIEVEAPQVKAATECCATYDLLEALGLATTSATATASTTSTLDTSFRTTDSDLESTTSARIQKTPSVRVGGKRIIVDEIKIVVTDTDGEKQTTLLGSPILRAHTSIGVAIDKPKPPIGINSDKLVSIIPQKTDSNHSKDLFSAKLVRVSVDEAKVQPQLPSSATLAHTTTPTTVVTVEASTKFQDIVREFSRDDIKMPRPQILHIVDSRKLCDFPTPPPSDKQSSGNSSQASGDSDEQHHELQEKVDSVRCYWSKLANDINRPHTDEPNAKLAVCETNSVRSVDDYKDEVHTGQNEMKSAWYRNYFKDHHDIEDPAFQSFSPLVEIIELDGKKHAAVVQTQNSLNEHDFDHVRYKVMKSTTFQKNLKAKSHKEAQFDGLLQYLQDYSFQELLAHNNVVIIEPVRTKIEKVSGDHTQTAQNQTTCKITGGSALRHTAVDAKNGLKKHFFYHPVRVNKELIDEELPTPDTVRNVRKIFEGSLRLRTPQNGHTNNGNHVDNGGGDGDGDIQSTTSGNGQPGQRINESLRRKALRYLTIDTSFGNAAIGIRKWDSASLSSGISSGELSSPCDCNEHEMVDEAEHRNGDGCTRGSRARRDDVDHEEHEVAVDMFSSEENLCDDELHESYYVSQDVLEKIRECGSSVTYYGGRVVAKKSAQMSPMTKAIMQEIRGEDNKCAVCQPKLCPSAIAIDAQFPKADNYLGVKFKLVKSNSCSSRLELAGTGQTASSLVEANDIDRPSSPSQPAEESVRSLVNRLETGAILQKSIPRIIESKCIEKMSSTVTASPFATASAPAPAPACTVTGVDTPPVTINSQLIEVDSPTKIVKSFTSADLIHPVTVNNHITYSSVGNALPPAGNGKMKICRNRNVDLAFDMNRNGANKPAKDKENTARKTNLGLLQANNNNNNNNTHGMTILTNGSSILKSNAQTFKDAKEVLAIDNLKMINGERTPTTELQLSHKRQSIEQHVPPTHVTIVEQRTHANLIDNRKRSSADTKSRLERLDEATPETEDNVSSSEKIDVTATTTVATAAAVAAADDDHNLQTQLVQWGSLSKFDEKNYFTNDRKLRERKKYDEMEFEEFEVFQSHSDCFDSLNSK